MSTRNVVNTSQCLSLKEYRLVDGRIEFPSYKLKYIDDYLAKRGFDVTSISDETSSVQCSDDVVIKEIENAEIDRYDIDVWYNALSRFTFNTIFFPLSKEDTCNMVKVYKNVLYRSINGSDWDLLRDLIRRIDEFLKQHGSKSWFVRTNAVSPKDVVEIHDLGKGVLNYELDRLENKDAKGQFSKLCARTATVALMALCHSDRVFACFECKSEGNSLVFREWLSEIPLAWEFRCFVKKGIITAISQYYWTEYYSELQNQEEFIRDTICQFFDGDVKDAITELYPDCVMDVVLWKNSGRDTHKDLGVFIIELNPFGGSLVTCSSLFNWELDYDILYGITKTPEIRLRKQNHQYEDNNASSDSDSE